jgi:hypothetical protein
MQNVRPDPSAFFNPSDNRGAGSSIGHALESLPDGTKIKVMVTQ